MKGNKFVFGIIAGALIGALGGLLIAPKPGKESREIVAIRAGELRTKAGDYVTTLREKVRRGAPVGVDEETNGYLSSTE